MALKFIILSSFLCLITERMEQGTFIGKESVIELFSQAGWIFKPGKRSGEPEVCRFLGLE